MKLFDKTTLLTVTIIICCGFNSLANAAVTIDVEDNIKVTAIDGQATDRSFFKKAKNQFVLQPGRHVITAKYNRLYDLRKDEHDYLRSSNMTVTAQLDDNQTYRLVMPNQPKNYREAKKFAKNPTLALMQGPKIIASQSAQNSKNANSNGTLSGLGNNVGSTLSGWFGGGSASAVNQNSQTIVDGMAPLTSASTSTSNEVASSVANTGSTLDKFIQIWLEATPTERERIRGWVSNH